MNALSSIRDQTTFDFKLRNEDKEESVSRPKVGPVLLSSSQPMTANPPPPPSPLPAVACVMMVAEIKEEKSSLYTQQLQALCRQL